ncbi:MAG: Nre family DNA repair protein [Methanocellales archaeon]|nr:Nre family DNA repair protein [Methanocellales archaeon]
MKDSLCAVCKGKGLCGRPCPILAKFRATERISPIGDSISGASPPSVFVGRMGYPNIRAGPLVPPLITAKDAPVYDDPRSWLSKSIEDVISLRSNLVRSNLRLNVKDARISTNRLLVKIQELAMASTPVDTEVHFYKPPKRELRFDDVLSPMGPSGMIKTLEITENPSVPRKVDHLVFDTDVLARDAIGELYKGDISTYYICRLLSVGLLGRQGDRRLVPTRWSITATDDVIGKELITQVKSYSELDEIRVFSAQKFGNRFEILLLPKIFSFELIEIWLPKSVWMSKGTWIGEDREGYDGRTTYSHLAGGYYAARLGVLEYLERIRRQALVFVVREILPDYWAPLGSWVIRETVRNAMAQQPKRFDAIEEAIGDLAMRIRTPLSKWRTKAKLLADYKFQKTLANFFTDKTRECSSC